MKNFTLSLYAFHLYHTLTDDLDKTTDDSKDLWENLVALGEKSLNFAQLKDLRSKLICYEKNEFNDKYNKQLCLSLLICSGISPLLFARCFYASPKYKYKPTHDENQETDGLTKFGSNSNVIDLGCVKVKGFDIQGELQPFCLNDTYAVDLTLFTKPSDFEIDAEKVKEFLPNHLLPNSIDASLGQTLWIYGEVDPDKNKNIDDYEHDAKSYAEALLKVGDEIKLHLSKVKKGELFGNFIFEYEATDPQEPQNYAKNCHILVQINNGQTDTTTKLGEAYNWLRDYLCCRHKINSIYQLALERKPQARRLYSKLEKNIEKFYTDINNPKKRLENLKQLLTNTSHDAFNYKLCLRDLKAHQTAISTNIKNYKKCLQKIEKIGLIPEFWKDFVNDTYEQWQTQIQIDIEYLAPGQDLFGQFMDTIRGIVQIDQARLANRITAIGTGFTSASLFASASILSAQSSPHIEAIGEIVTGKESIQNLKFEPKHKDKDLVDSAVACSLTLVIAIAVG
jgi:hypothetical protein